VLGILISRVTGRPLGEHLAEDVFGPVAMTGTALWVAAGKLGRLPAACRHGAEGLAEAGPAGGGFCAGAAVVRRQPRRARSRPRAAITASPGCLPEQGGPAGSR